MDLYKLKKNKLEQVDISYFNLEKDIQEIVENNSEELFQLEFVSSEFSAQKFRLDSVCFDNETNSFVIIEYKKSKKFSVIDQGFTYLSLMLNNKADFILEYNENKNKTLNRKSVDWTQSRVIFISTGFTDYQINSVNFKDVPFELWEIKKYENDLIGLVHLLPTSNESIQNVTSSNNTVIKSVTSEVKVYDEDHIFSGKSEQVRKLYNRLKSDFSELDEVKIKINRNYISFKRRSWVFLYINSKKNHLTLHILKGYLGTKNKFLLDDPKNIFKEKKTKGGNLLLYEYLMKDEKNYDYAFLMIKQKYESHASKS